MRVFPGWANSLGLEDAVIKGVDFPLHAPANPIGLQLGS